MLNGNDSLLTENMKITVTALLLSAAAATPAYAADTMTTSAPASEISGGERRASAPAPRAEEAETLFYAPGKNSPDESARERLQAWAQRMAGKPGLRVEITGHADERLPTLRARTIYGDNLGISNARAKEAAAALRAQAGFAEVPISLAGKGDTEPKVSCSRKTTAKAYVDCLAPNRRVEIRGRYDNESVAVIAAAPAPAAEPAVETKSEAATETLTDNGFYAAIDLGKVSYSGTASNYDGNELPNPLMVRIGGGYRFTRHLGVEAGYALVGESAIKSTPAANVTESLKSTTLQLAAVGTYPINEAFGVFGKLGLSYTKLDYNYADTGINGSGSGSKVNPMYGLGVQYNINKRHGIRAQYENFGKTGLSATYSDGTTATMDIGTTVISAGWVYNY